MGAFHSGWTRRATAAVLIAALLAAPAPGGLAQTTAASASANGERTAAQADVLEIGSYREYRAGAAAATPEKEILIPADAYTAYEGEAPGVKTNFAASEGRALYLPDSGSVTWSFTVEQAGDYCLKFLYYPVEGNGNSILREVWIDGKLPFRESAEVSLERRWVNSGAASFDAAGNQIRPKQQEEPAWMEKAAEDAAGSAGALQYALSKGTHTVTLTAKREPVVLKSLTFCPAETVRSYKETAEEYQRKGYASVSPEAGLTLEAEDAQAKSDQTMYPLADRTTPSVTPYSASAIRYNTVGSSQWKTAGQWLEWVVDIPESGLYQIGAHYQQNLKTAGSSIRELTIDGQLPFAEAASIEFPYNRAWRAEPFADKNGEAYRFYLTEGRHTVRLRVTLGDAQAFAADIDACIAALNAVYRRVVVITGTSPDPYRDYQFEKLIPDVLEDMASLSEELKALEARLASEFSAGNSGTQSIRRLYGVLDTMTEDPDDIRVWLSSYRDYISSLATWKNDFLEQPLVLDSLYFTAVGAKLPAGEAGFLELAAHYVRQFFYSFVSDYNTIGNLATETETQLKVWMSTGRDQAQILKQLINDRFIPAHSIGVQLQLVPTDALLPALVAKNEPDVFLGLAQADPLNLALRGALLNLGECESYQEVSGRFADVALEPFRFNGGVYALPDTQTYPMLFYRKDILKELNIPVSALSDWNSVLKKVLPVLQKNSLMLGVSANINSWLMLFYQKGQELYAPDQKTVRLDTAEAVEAMELYAMLYKQYELALAYDFANRFRSGEIPVAIADYTSYNQLTVFAPEIKGLWGMLPVPGTVDGDTVHHEAVSTVTGSVILSATKSPGAAWDFLCWWTSAEIQAAYGKDLESVVGSAARYNTANTEALNSVQWDADMREQLLLQRQSLKAYPEIPGGYYTARNFDFAFRDVLYSGVNIRDALGDAAKEINQEIQKKRREYNLD